MLSRVKLPSLARRSVAIYVASLLTLAGCLAIGVRLFRDSDRYERQDFDRYYAEASVLSSGGNPWRIFEFSAPRDMNVPSQVGYPPAFYLMFSPLCRFRPATAHRLWEALQIIALISALTLVLREIGRTANNTFTRLAFAFAFLFLPLHSALHWGQPTPLLLLLLVGSWACARRGWEMSAGALIAIATLLKIFPCVVCGYFLFRRRWKVLASSLIFALAISLYLLALYGIDRNLDFLRGTQISPFWLDRRRNLSMVGNLHAFVAGMSGDGRTLDWRLLGLLVAFFGLSIVSVSGLLTSRLPDEPAETSGLCWSLWIISSILLSPVAWDHYLVLLIPMYIFLASQMALDLKNNAFCQTNRRSVLVGASLLVGGLSGFLSIPYFAAARYAHGYLILVLTSYVGLCVMLAATERSPSTASPGRMQVPSV
jgi:glycosyl transferase family 87